MRPERYAPECCKFRRLRVNKPQPVVLFEIVKGWLTGSDPDIGVMHEVTK
jgi:hypothetical protein